jgi:putative ABC transport system ATP-binding protein
MAIVGPSGSGKTTLLKLIAGIERPSEGQIEVCGIDVAAMDDQQRRRFRIGEIGFVFQNFELIDYLNVGDNIVLPYLINKGLKLNSEVRQRATELATQMSIETLLSRYPAKLSQGEKQRVAICRSLITSPQLILADEPTGNLDPHNKQVILDLFFGQLGNSERSLLMVTHDLSIAQQCDVVVDFSKFHAPQTGATASPQTGEKTGAFL